MTTALGALRDHRVDPPCRDLLRVAARTHGRHDHDALVLQRLHESFARRLGEARDLHAFAHHQRDALINVGLIGSQVHTERLVRPGLHRRDRRREFWDAHRGAREDSEAACRARRCGQSCARHPAHTGLHNRVLHPKEFTRSGVQRRVAHGFGTSLSRRLCGSITMRISSSSSAVGARVSGTSLGTTSSNPVAATTSSTVTPGCTECNRIR